MAASVVRQIVGRSKAVDAPVLNRLGLQVGRTVAAAALARARRRTVAPAVAATIADLDRQGYAVLTDLLAPDDLAEVTATARRVTDDPAVAHADNPQGGNSLRVTWRLDVAEADRRVLDRFFLHPTVLALASAAERLELEPGAGRCTVQELVQHDGPPDIEAAIHSDTFHPTHKIWLYLSDIDDEDGPLTYYPGSQRLSLASLRGTYQDSVGPNLGARRIGDRERASRGIEPERFCCRANTLVIANTFGYHGRAQGWSPGRRLSLHLEVRPDPFRRPARMRADTTRLGPAQVGA